MRNFHLRCSIAMLAIVLPAVLVRAQFQPPTDEELKMTSDPKAPGADAVYLDLEETDNNPLAIESHYARIKVLTEKGKEMATVELPYLNRYAKVTGIKGRTIHADGTVVPLNVKPEDLTIAKAGDEQFNRKVFTLPSVEVGSILEYRYDISNCDQKTGGCYLEPPTWEVQKRILCTRRIMCSCRLRRSRRVTQPPRLPTYPPMPTTADASFRALLTYSDYRQAPRLRLA